MGLKSAEQVILFDFFFIFLVAVYGGSTGSSSITLANFQSIPVPLLAPLPPTIHCGITDFVCAGTKDITTATAYVGWAIVNLPVILIYFLIVMITFADMILNITFQPGFGTNGVPILGFIFIALQVVVIFEVFRLFRGSSSGF